MVPECWVEWEKVPKKYECIVLKFNIKNIDEANDLADYYRNNESCSESFNECSKNIESDFNKGFIKKDSEENIYVCQQITHPMTISARRLILRTMMTRLMNVNTLP